MKLIDRCLWAYVDRRQGDSKAELVQRFSAEVFQRAPYLREWMAEHYQSKVLQPVFSLDENLYEPTAIPIFFRAFDPETNSRCSCGTTDWRRVLLYLDWTQYARVVEEHGGVLTWSSQKAARAQHALPRHKRATVVGDRIPIMSLPDGRSVTGQSWIYRVYFNGILPSVVADQYIEMLQW